MGGRRVQDRHGPQPHPVSVCKVNLIVIKFYPYWLI
jgi:hypothetical protein